MQDPTHSDGRHAATAGSLTVADLLARRTEAERRTAADRATHARNPVSVAGDAAADQPDTSGGRLGRAVLAGGLVAVVVGSLGGAALSGVPAPLRPSPVAQPDVVAGPDALRPDVVGAELLGDGTAQDLAAPAAPAPDAPPEADLPTAGSAGPAAERTGPSQPEPRRGPAPGGAPEVSAVDTVGLVKEFFASLPTRPESAVALLDPVLGTVDPGGFRQAWRGVRSVDVLQVTLQDDGRIRASVVLERTDGARLRTEHLLTVTDGPQPRITGVVLLAAQQL